MTRTIVYAISRAVFALGVRGRAHLLYGRATANARLFAGLASPPNPTAPNVFIVNDKIIIDQEPIIPPGQAGDTVTIFFALDQNGSYAFPNNGIEIHQYPGFCSSVSAYVFLCKYTKPAAGTIYKYVVRVKKDSGPMLKELDPTIWN